MRDSEVSTTRKLKKQLRLGAIRRAARDMAVAEEWFPVDESAWSRGRSK